MAAYDDERYNPREAHEEARLMAALETAPTADELAADYDDRDYRDDGDDWEIEEVDYGDDWERDTESWGIAYDDTPYSDYGDYADYGDYGDYADYGDYGD